MLVYWQCFGEKVCQIIDAFAPHDFELSLTYAVSNPVELHINALCALGFYCIRGDAMSTFIVT